MGRGGGGKAPDADDGRVGDTLEGGLHDSHGGRGAVIRGKTIDSLTRGGVA